LSKEKLAKKEDVEKNFFEISQIYTRRTLKTKTENQVYSALNTL